MTVAFLWIGLTLVVLALVSASYNAPRWVFSAILIAVCACFVGLAYGVSEWMWRNMI